MTDRPLVLSADQVRAYLAGKTQDRVVLDPQPAVSVMPDGYYVDAYCSEPRTPENPRRMSCNWCLWTHDHRQGCAFTTTSAKPGDRFWIQQPYSLSVVYASEADAGDALSDQSGMPPETLSRAQSRLTLIVTDVRVQRLQDISEEDCRAELGLETDYAADMFDIDWDKAHPNPTHQWAANPWVEARTFRVVNRNIDEV